MRIAVIGSGGVGGYFGARLAMGGADVRFLARGEHLRTLRSDGIRVEGGPEPLHIPKVTATDDPSGLGEVDYALIAVKLWDTEAVLGRLAGVVGPDTTVISFQNGVLKDDYLKQAFDPAQVMGGVGYVATTIDRPGVIRQTGPMQRLLFGEFDGRSSVRGEAFLGACLAGGIDAELSRDIQLEIWRKFVFLVGLSATTTTMRMPIGSIRAAPRGRAFLLDVMREVVDVGRALGVDLPPDFAERRLSLADEVSPDMTSSMHHDLQRRRPLEVRWLSGGVVRLGLKVGVATPLNRAVADILSIHELGGEPDDPSPGTHADAA
ncbi:ketopantoate reductase family protein [Methylobacterium sp. J-070]|uniref:ketopantoate reductase family protein n=1 Tax=Methylobacterium sp. J-070 TaxID=2836650 RepID=UPI001FBA7380|nr:2-dehydropantoate 2-reductase [Methylobacterium sp. J-070]MCJ2048933.1 2-dehydropantoate 2-reductase [Methylobacterium sp. J-070]